MINPSQINVFSLPWLPLDAKSAFPKNPAIFFAIDSQGTLKRDRQVFAARITQIQEYLLRQGGNGSGGGRF